MLVRLRCKFNTEIYTTRYFQALCILMCFLKKKQQQKLFCWAKIKSERKIKKITWEILSIPITASIGFSRVSCSQLLLITCH